MNVASIVQILAGLSWMVVVGAVIFAGMTMARKGKLGGIIALVVGAVIAAVVLNVTAAGLVFVQPEERGVVISALQPQGYRTEALEPGLRWVVPFFENVRTYQISRQTYTMSSATGEGQVQGDDSVRARTKDGQEVLIDTSVIYAVDPAQVIQLHIRWQNRYQDELVRPVARGVIRDAASQYGVEEIVSSKRAEMEQTITEQLASRFKTNNLELVQFVLRDIRFSPEYAAAVEQKQIAEQQAQQAAFVVQQKRQEAEQARQVAQGKADAAVIAAKGEAESRLIQADAEAKALQLIASALKENPDLLQYTYVQKLGPNVQVMLVPSNSPYLFQLPQAPTAPTTTTEPSPAP